ncbi:MULTISPECIES: DNA cytosine methyltransferase [unclassified Streptomyces]|uniref:DNA cytosine methyltransferase n=1 Tax=unclassified Streptomyces TaxID=2593676 RepID=UPI0036682540
MGDQQEETITPRIRTSVELFAGGGGLAMGVHRAGFRPLLFNEFNRRACETLLASAGRTLGDDGLVAIGETTPVPPRVGEPAPLYPGDVRELDLRKFEGEVDILAGGPPCQPFSAGGVAKGDEDKRNMFPAVFNAVREMRPKAVICENVRGILRPSFADYFGYIKNELRLPFMERDPKKTWQRHNGALLSALGDPDPVSHRLDIDGGLPVDDRSPDHYRVIAFPVNAADHGVPQIRNRVVIVAFRADLGVGIVRDFAEHVGRRRYSDHALYRSMREADGAYWERHHVEPHVRDRVMARLPKEPGKDKCLPWRTLRDAIAGYGTDERLLALPHVDTGRLTEKHDFGGSAFPGHVGWPGARIYKGHTPNELDRPAKTVKAGVHGVPGGESVLELDDLVEDPTAPGGWRYDHRYMTVRETARVMTFPDEWVGSGPRGEQMRQLGNAVPVVLGEFFAKAVATALDAAGQ